MSTRPNAWQHATMCERAEALRAAAGMLHARHPKNQCYCRVRLGPNEFDAHAVAQWAGVVRLTMRYSGELIAQSLAGKPFEIDAAAVGGGTP